MRTCDQLPKCFKCLDVIESMNWHVNLGQAPYESKLDGSIVDFHLCDSCMIDYIQSMPLESQEIIINSGSNLYLRAEEWIRLHKGEMTDQEMKEKGLRGHSYYI